jgi:hypothetical protein
MIAMCILILIIAFLESRQTGLLNRQACQVREETFKKLGELRGISWSALNLKKACNSHSI